VSAAAEFWRAIFGTPHAVEIEIGPGRGDVLLAFAAARPETNFFGIEHSAGLAGSVALEAAARGLANVRMVAGDARCIVTRLVPPASIAAVHVYFPDPWPKTRHRRRRLFDGPELAEAIARALAPGGAVHVATDLPWLHDRMRARLAAAGLVEVASPTGVRPTSKFERKYAAGGTYAATLVRPP
jgi:tRNA (guanine-N7-)-methyltransferase